MYRIYSGDAQVGMMENPNFIRKVENGSFNLCSEQDAQGIAYDGKVYSLGTNGGIANVPEVHLQYQDTAVDIARTNNVTSIAFVTMAEKGDIDALTAGENMDMFAEWATNVSYRTGQIRQYEEALYQCVQDHISQETWNPKDAATLWKKIADPREEWPSWSQPIAAYDAYSIGSKVSHAEKHWVSEVDNNVWEPGVYGWSEVVAEE